MPLHVRPLLSWSVHLSFHTMLDRHDFCYSLFFPPSIIQYFSAFLYLCHRSPRHISGSLFYLYPLIPPSCCLADLNPVLFWSSAQGDANSMWLSVAAHFLSCPSAFTACMRERQKDSDVWGLESEKMRNGEKEDTFREALKYKLDTKTFRWLGYLLNNHLVIINDCHE